MIPTRTMKKKIFKNINEINYHIQTIVSEYQYLADYMIKSVDIKPVFNKYKKDIALGQDEIYSLSMDETEKLIVKVETENNVFLRLSQTELREIENVFVESKLSKSEIIESAKIINIKQKELDSWLNTVGIKKRNKVGFGKNR